MDLDSPSDVSIGQEEHEVSPLEYALMDEDEESLDVDIDVFSVSSEDDKKTKLPRRKRPQRSQQRSGGILSKLRKDAKRPRRRSVAIVKTESSRQSQWMTTQHNSSALVNQVVIYILPLLTGNAQRGQD